MHYRTLRHARATREAGPVSRAVRPALAAFAFGALPLTRILAPTPVAAADGLTLDARLAHPIMKGGVATKNYLRVGLGGCRPTPAHDRGAVNVALVIDRSGSMRGERIAQARAAAAMAVARLQGADMAAVVIFDEAVDVLVPSQPVIDPRLYADLIHRVQPRGSTNIHGGVLAGAAEVRKYKAPGRLNRVVLLSDGLANVGPSHPEAFARLGRALLAEGISVSTVGLGLGYNEDLMLALARSSDGNHAFAQEPADLVQIFNREFNDVLASCAHSVAIEIDLKPGVRAVRALSRDGSIAEARAQFRLNQVYAATEHYVLLEVEVDKSAALLGEQELATVKVAYTQGKGDGARAASQMLTTAVRGRFTGSDAEIASGTDDKVAAAVVEQAVNERSRQAVLLRDQGKHEEARQLLMQNAADIGAYAANSKAPSPDLLSLGKKYNALAAQPAPSSATEQGAQRKALRELQAPAAGSGTRY